MYCIVNHLAFSIAYAWAEKGIASTFTETLFKRERYSDPNVSLGVKEVTLLPNGHCRIDNHQYYFSAGRIKHTPPEVGFDDFTAEGRELFNQRDFPPIYNKKDKKIIVYMSLID